MRKTISVLLVVVAAASSISIHEAAAQSRGDRNRSESFSRGSEDRGNYRYQRYCMPTINGAGRLYSDDKRSWRRVSSCNGYQLVD